MGLYFFHVRGGAIEAEDEDGVELPDLDAVRRDAIQGARGIIAAEVLEGRLTLSERIEVSDCQGRHVLTLNFRAAVTPSS